MIRAPRRVDPTPDPQEPDDMRSDGEGRPDRAGSADGAVDGRAGKDGIDARLDELTRDPDVTRIAPPPAAGDQVASPIVAVVIPAFVARGPVRIAFGNMGGFNQAQAQAQLLPDVVDHGMDIQAALETPRSSKPSCDGCDLELEDGVAPSVRAGLSALGHEIRLRGRFSPEAVGGGQAVMRDGRAGVDYGASDPRKDGEAIPEPTWAIPGR